MNRIFEFNYSGIEFRTFSNTHVLTLLSLIVINTLFLIVLKKNDRLRKMFRYSTAVVLIIVELTFYIWEWRRGTFSVSTSLPLDICGMAMIFSIIVLLNGNKFLYQIIFFWGLGGATQALLTPDLYFSFPHFIFLRFFFVHACIITTVLYFTIVEKYRPFPSSIWKAVVFSLGYLAVIGIFNLTFDSNYMYICNKPSDPTIIDYLGEWPLYILSLIGVGVCSMLICYLPFYIGDCLEKSGKTKSSL